MVVCNSLCIFFLKARTWFSCGGASRCLSGIAPKKKSPKKGEKEKENGLTYYKGIDHQLQSSTLMI